MKRALAACLLLVLACCAAFAQTVAQTTPMPLLVTTGGTFQLALTSVTSNNQRRTLEMQNNNETTDNCRVLVGGPWQAGDTLATSRTVSGVTLTAKQGSLLLLPGGSVTRLQGYIPSDQLLITCATTGNSFYLDIQ